MDEYDEYKDGYKEFTFTNWPSDERWIALTDSNINAREQARQFFWERNHSSILVELQKLQEWEPIEEPGPAALEVERSQIIDRSIDPADVLLWIMTLGIGFLIHLAMNKPRIYTAYIPIAFRVKMRSV